MRLAIADPPYPPHANGRHLRASRWYGDAQLSKKDRVGDFHPAAAEWDDPARHRQLLEDLLREYDGWAIATSSDGTDAYRPLPKEARVMAWVRPNAQPGSHRLRSLWEAVILYPPVGRRSNRGGVGSVPNVLVCPSPTSRGFVGAKPPEWTRWVLSALSYNAETDTVADLFHGSGSVAAAVCP